MKARVFTAKQRDLMHRVASEEAERQIMDAAKRAQAIWCLAALNAGYKPSTVLRICAEVPFVLDGFAEYKKDGVADYVLFNALAERGVDFEMPTRTRI